MRNCKFLPHPKSLPQGEGLEFDFSSLADFQHHYSPSLADGARGWVSSLQGARAKQVQRSNPQNTI